ncbi:S41 family peptidase [Chitinophaga sancti]|uniref:Peptidase family S41 n=1 Tax=Chitinophaga sancti TaxID=1004 RepID=A0A1K1QHZ3_9BACT|nr:S41 family peptidase [Chitinophaga sancti]WQD65250.1 S41 family peptidase [Chitinophaga sancti]WQG89126.1 S41 family peptidase [Chitinophaga sancti]SFW59543.1 Peptidase family S41 [Chitinophaga sancti]
MFNYPALIRLFVVYLLLNLIYQPFSFAQKKSCSCRNNFDELVAKVATNYPGYTIKITTENQAAFNLFTDSLRNIADTANAVTCFSVLQSWTAYFKDRHLALVFKDIPENKDLIDQIFANSESFPLSRDSLLKKWATTTDYPLEGLWTLSGMYEVAVIKKDNGYLGIILKGDNTYWKPGQVKFKLQPESNECWKVIQYNQYHMQDTFRAYVDERSYIMDLKSYNWEKTFPGQPGLKTIPADSFYFSKIDSNNTILRLPSFALPYKPLIDSLITSNFYTITHTPHLIVDLRGNVGGYNLCFEKLLPLLYTNPVITPGPVFKSTTENIHLYKMMLKSPLFPKDKKAPFTSMLNNLKKNKNGYYQTPADTTRYPQVYTQPEKIGLLIDEGSASATELLILDAKQSKKVTLFGKRSAGVVDYINLVAPRPLSCYRFLLWIPTARLASLPQHPIDNTGILPDVEIPHHENWINYVSQYLENLDLKIVNTSK